MLHFNIKITVAIPFKNETSTHCCFIVGPASQTVIQRDKSMCLLGPLNVFPFDKQIYNNFKKQKLSGDF